MFNLVPGGIVKTQISYIMMKHKGITNSWRTDKVYYLSVIMLLLTLIPTWGSAQIPEFDLDCDNRKINSRDSNGARCGLWVFYSLENPIYIVEVHNIQNLRIDTLSTIRNGDYRILGIGAYRKDKMDGVWRSYYSNGLLDSEYSMKNDSLIGKFIKFRSNGEMFLSGTINQQALENDSIEVKFIQDKAERAIGLSELYTILNISSIKEQP